MRLTENCPVCFLNTGYDNDSIDSTQVNHSILLTFKPWHKSCWSQDSLPAEVT